MSAGAITVRFYSEEEAKKVREDAAAAGLGKRLGTYARLKLGLPRRAKGGRRAGAGRKKAEPVATP